MVLKRCVSLCSAPVLAGVLAAGSSAAEVPEICVECSGPIATYRCIVPDAAKVDDLRGRDRALGELCVTEIAKSGGHEKCRVRRGASGQVCIGLERTVGLTDVLNGSSPGAQDDKAQANAEDQKSADAASADA